MIVAFASDNLAEVDQHFGWATSFAVWEICPGLTPAAMEPVFLSPEGDDNDDKIEARIEALSHCDIIYCTSIGGAAAARLIAKRMLPIKAPERQSIEQLVNRLKEKLEKNPPPWLRKIKHKQTFSVSRETENRGI